MKNSCKAIAEKIAVLALLSGLGLAGCSTVPETTSRSVVGGPASKTVAYSTQSKILQFEATTPQRKHGSDGNKWLPEGRHIFAPTSFLEMCERSPQDCAVSSDQSGSQVRHAAQAMLARKNGLAFLSGGAAVEEVSPASTRRARGNLPLARRVVGAPSQAKLVDIVAYRSNSEPLRLTSVRGKASLPSSDFAVVLPPFSWGEGPGAAWPIFDLPDETITAPLGMDVATEATGPVSGETLGDSDARVEIGSDRETMRLLQKINGDVNAILVSDTDQDIYQVTDYWNAPGLQRGSRGDCEDYALQKRRELVRLGIPAAAMSLALVRTRAGDSHAVLVVATEDGDYVLDNLSYTVKRWDQTGYRWISRQLPSAGLAWAALSQVSGK